MRDLPQIGWDGRVADSCVGWIGGIVGGLGGLTGPAPILWSPAAGLGPPHAACRVSDVQFLHAVPDRDRICVIGSGHNSALGHRVERVLR